MSFVWHNPGELIWIGAGRRCWGSWLAPPAFTPTPCAAHVAALEGAGVLVRDHVATGARGRQRTMVADAVLRQRNAAASLVNLVTAVSAPRDRPPETSLVRAF